MFSSKDFRFYVAWVCLFIFASLFFIIGIDHESIWFDESHTYAVMNHSFGEIINICAEDNHPPLNFIMAKVFVFIFGNNLLALRRK
ncbi:MAG: hypothetical protein JW881_13635 [Spirochaetales bacterium]|nr:hypothetical protein [Spirochaetales bacterium]